MPPVDDDSNVKVHNVAVLKCPITWNAVTDYMVERCADGFWKATIVQWSGDRSVIHDEFAAESVEFIGGHTRHHKWRYVV